jgi:NADH dehydrogenase
MISLMERGLHYEVHGSGEPLLLIHGTGSSLRVWDPIVGLLAAHRTVIAVDLPGFGFSPPITPGTPPTPGGFAGILAAFLRRLGHDDAHVTGNSVGGWTALVLVNAGDHILQGIDPSLVRATARRLASQRIEVINDAKVKEVRPDAVVLSDRRTIAARTTVWATGIEPPALVKSLDVDKDHRGRIRVDEFMRVNSRSGVYAVGDCTSIDYDGSPVPALAQVAEQEGKRAALNLAAEMKGEVLIPFHYRSLEQLVDVGEGSALVDILGAKASGRVGTLIWKGIYLYEFGYNLNRVQVLADWLIDLFARPDTSKLFEDSKRPSTVGR